MTTEPGMWDAAAGDALDELRFALAEADAEAPGGDLRRRVLDAALAARGPGRPATSVDRVTGAEAFRRAVDSLYDLLAGLDAADWARPALRDLTVQGLVGHLIGVEAAFTEAFDGASGAGAVDHVASTQSVALGQSGRPAAATLAEWDAHARRSLALADAADGSTSLSFYGLVLPLDDLLVVRAFEMWIHDEDIRRATGRALASPDPERLARMTELAVGLLPAGMAVAGLARPKTVRLVLTGPGGGTWDVALASGASRDDAARTRIVVDAAVFCRAVGDRVDLAGSGASVSGDADLAAEVFAGAAALALD